LPTHIRYDEPKFEDVVVVKPNKQVLGKELKKDAKPVQLALEALAEEAALALKEAFDKEGKGTVEAGECLEDRREREEKTKRAFVFNIIIPLPFIPLQILFVTLLRLKSHLASTVCTYTDGQSFTVTPAMVDIFRDKKKITGRNFTPSVIEPSFGIGRIIYCMFEHCFYQRPGTEDQPAEERRTVFRFTPLVAPVKATVFPLMQRDELNTAARQVRRPQEVLYGPHFLTPLHPISSYLSSETTNLVRTFFFA
jgi:glycyl-tRNA synthetase